MAFLLSAGCPSPSDVLTGPWARLTALISHYREVIPCILMGAIFHTPHVARRDLAELRAWCDRHRVTLVGTSARGAVLASGWAPALPLTLLSGCEGGGLTPEDQALCDYTVCIPMQGVNSSLNLATAAGILAYLGASARRSWAEPSTRAQGT